jgi:hypothetical protein
MSKHYGISGVGGDVQLGKAGGRFVYTGGVFKTTTDGSTLETLQVAEPSSGSDAATKTYVDSVASGLDPKESVQYATTSDPGGTYSSSGGSGGTGGYTAMTNSIDGGTLADGDRVLLKDASPATENGIYLVTTAGTGSNGVWERAADHDGSPAGEVSGGNFCFVENGTTNGNTGWVLQGDGNLTLNSDNLNWSMFSASGTIVAGNGLVKNGEALDLDFSELTSASTIALADELIFQDSGVESRITVQNFVDDREIPHGFSTTGLLTRTADNSWTTRSIAASAVAGDEGISVVNGDGVSGNMTIGIDIVGQTNIVTDDIDDADELLIYHSVGTGTEAAGNYAVTASKLKSYMNAGTSTTTISELDTSVVTSDTGTDGTITHTADGVVVQTATDTETSFSNAEVKIESSSSLFIQERADADADQAGYGQIWVDLATPNELYFTDDTGQDVQLTNNGSIAAVTSIGITAGTLIDVTGSPVTSSGSITVDVDLAEAAEAIYAPATDYLLFLDGGVAGTAAKESGADFATAIAGTGLSASSGTLTVDDVALGTSTTGDYVASITAGTGLSSTGATSGETISHTLSIDYLGTDNFIDAATNLEGTAIATGDTIIYHDATDDNVKKGFVSDLPFQTGSGSNDQVVTWSGTNSQDGSANFTNNNGVVAITGSLTVDEVQIDGDTISNTTTDQPLILRPNGTGSIIFQNGSSEEILELNDTVSAVNGLAITAGATGVAPDITTGTGAEANIDINFTTNGTGVLTVVAGSGNYEDNVTADDDIPNKKYVDDAVATATNSGLIGSISATVDLTSATAQTVGTLPANAAVLRTRLVVGTASDAATTVTVGDATNGAASYMAASENDPQSLDTYVADNYLLNGGADRTAQATVATAGTVGSATCIVEYRIA